MSTELADAVDRRLGSMISVGTAVLTVALLGTVRAQASTTAPAWTVAAVGLVLVTAVVAVGCRTLPVRVLRVGWSVYPVLAVVLVVTWVPARLDGAPASPWVWLMEPSAVAFATLAWRWKVAVVYAPVAALALPATLLLVDGTVVSTIVLQTVIHVGNVVFVAIFESIRHQLGTLWASEREADAQSRALAEVRARAVEQARFAAVVHDEVLAALATAMHERGEIPPLLAAQARSALAVVGGDEQRAAGGVPVGVLVGALRVSAEAAGALVVVEVDPSSRWVDGGVPAGVVEAVRAAADEALRNSSRHARPGLGAERVTRTVTVRVVQDTVTVEVVDDGSGFDVAAVPPTRLGLSGSVVARMQALDGGDAHVWSALGRGTRVRLVWGSP